MKYVILLFVLALPAAAVITPSGSPVSCVAPSNSANSCPAPGPLTLAQGDAIVLIVHTANATPAYTVTQTGCTLTWQPQPFANNIQFFTALNVAAGSCTITVSRPVGTNDAYFAWMAQVYSGVNSLGAFVPGTTGNGSLVTSPPCQLQITTQDPGNFVIGAGSWNQGSNLSLNVTVASGTSRYAQQWAGSTFRVADNTSPSIGNVNVSFNWTIASGIAYCGMNALELRAASTITGGRLARMSDQQQTVLLQGSGIVNYTLPNTIMSPTWCAYLMPAPVGSPGTYQLQVQSPSQLNGQSNAIALQPWQMSRVCEDESSNYWASPPLIAGSGISIAGSSEHVTISGAAARRSDPARDPPQRTAPQPVRRNSRIAIGASVICAEPSNSVTNCRGPALAVSPGDVIILGMASTLAAPTPYTISDTCNHQWTVWRNDVPQIWVGTGGTDTSCVIESSRPSGTDVGQAWVAVAYSGVQSVGPATPPGTSGSACAGTGGAGLSATCGQTITTQNDGNSVLAMVYLNVGTNQNIQVTAASGILRGPIASTLSRTVAMIENTSPTAGPVTASATYSSPTSGATGFRSAVELVAAPPGPAPIGYFANPPFVAGPGITLTPGPTGIVISTTPTQ